jgi:alpha-mannosidase
MNNYWETNYKADNEGEFVFRYALRPHKGFDAAAAARFGVEQSQPLVVVPVKKDAPDVRSLFAVEPAEVLLTSLKPSEDQKALMLRLYNAGDRPAKVRVNWAAFQPKRVAISSPREEQGPAWSGAADLPPLGILTLRAEWE